MIGEFAIRPATVNDAASIARIHVESWRTTYAGMLPDDLLLGLRSGEPESRRWRQVLGRFRRNHEVVVADTPKDGVVGFASGGPSRDRLLNFDGEIYALYLLDDYQNAGLGKALFAEMSARLKDTRGPSMIVWALGTNPARFFYEAMGGRLVARRPSRVGGTDVEELAYGWDDVSNVLAVHRSR